MSIIYNIALTLISGIGATKAAKILEVFGSAKIAFETSREEALMKDVSQDIINKIAVQKEAVLERAQNIVQHCDKNNIEILSIDDTRYPDLLREISDAPTVLYVRGATNFNNANPVAIVGTRAASAIAIGECRKIIQNLATVDNVYTVSGLALGIDKHAHIESIKNNIPTVAVMAGWVDDIVPRSHYSVARQIVDNGGSIISEMPPGSMIAAASFLVRNRIIAGLSKATIMIQSAVRGGSMATANLAFNYDREVFVPLGDNSPAFEGNVTLAKQNKAHILQSFSDILNVMNWNSKEPTMKTIDHLPNNMITALGKLPDHDFSLELAADCWQNDITEACRTISMLEINGLISTLKGGLYSKI